MDGGLAVAQIRVLLIEDDPMVREVNRQFIEKVEHFQVVGQAPNGLEGITQICQLKPDLVFMDILCQSKMVLQAYAKYVSSIYQ